MGCLLFDCRYSTMDYSLVLPFTVVILAGGILSADPKSGGKYYYVLFHLSLLYCYPFTTLEYIDTYYHKTTTVYAKG